MSLTNSHVAELLARAGEGAEGHWARALRKASRAALGWPEEIAALAARGGRLTELARVGPRLERLLLEWLEQPPEVPEPAPARAGFLTFAEARALASEHPEWEAGLRGDLQMHTTYSDGSASVEEMAHAGFALGYEYIAVTDHSKSLKIAGGMDEELLARQGDEIERLNVRLAEDRHRLLRSIEMNLSPDGAGDMDEHALEHLDLVLGSFHSQLRKTEDQTHRYLSALRHPRAHVLGHPRGRIYNSRVGLHADWPRVFEEAARLGKAVEIDCYPDRQDLDVELLKLAREAGTWVSIGTDSHHPGELVFMPLGLAAALEAGLPRERILNYLPVDGLVEWAREVGKDMRAERGGGARRAR